MFMISRTSRPDVRPRLVYILTCLLTVVCRADGWREASASAATAYGATSGFASRHALRSAPVPQRHRATLGWRHRPQRTTGACINISKICDVLNIRFCRYRIIIRIGITCVCFYAFSRCLHWTVSIRLSILSQIPGNKMDSNNLATLFGPNILHKAKGREFEVESIERLEERGDVITVVRTLIEQYTHVFEVSRRHRSTDVYVVTCAVRLPVAAGLCCVSCYVYSWCLSTLDLSVAFHDDSSLSCVL